MKMGQAMRWRTQAVDLKVGLVFRKSQKISTVSDRYFLSYVKKIIGGGGPGPPPSRGRVKI